ncbi:hypothetical protein VSDG_02608 [Cytospora chrysosperma]|uniref:Uncharacterized protein n=1 Tax=Cytospora chrysosperma TaxID=252740 RepID=A0A423WG02_CYTCH|nr:hypothetical protein VSDG_02608 [Valsa sordida]
MSPSLGEPPVMEEKAQFELVMKHGHQDLVQAVAFNSYGDRCATGSVDGKIRVFNRHKDGIWRLCDTWTAHGGEILELQWLPPTVYPGLLASLGIEGRFKLWAEDPSAAPGRRFGNRSKDNAKAAFEHRSPRAPYRSFSLKHNEETRQTHLALLAADGRLTVYENEMSENLSDWSQMDELSVCEKPARGEEKSFRVRFDPNPDPCYTALRAGMPADTLSLIVAAMHEVKIYRTRDIVIHSYGVPSTKKEFYEAATMPDHRGLVRDVAWAPGNIRGYDIIASACMDGYVRVIRVDTPYDKNDGRTWSSNDLARGGSRPENPSRAAGAGPSGGHPQHPSGISQGVHHPATEGDRRRNQAGNILHTMRYLSTLENHRTPMWRVGFDDDGQILGCVGDDGKLMCFRQQADGRWTKSSEIGITKMKMAVPS